MENKYCSHCQKPLKVVGNLRKNGKNHDDWDSRSLHKKCWITERKLRKFDIYILLQEKKFK